MPLLLRLPFPLPFSLVLSRSLPHSKLGRELEYTELGKPHAIAYKYAEKVLREQAEKSGKNLDIIYGIGDNPSSGKESN
jgi:hypothetical protein